ncbi:complement C1q-like protein 2 [Austrofundulus limnaeus]|uniref:Complement C1q-like protein 2 n=1 Tax=Austrofundulus limnaeus TaxID=52670 RepID=A0A2I4CY58_AUSLI|nr:PREDICTED: complement C1q-like protein 2 [Austrofundulus limnaeus]
MVSCLFLVVLGVCGLVGAQQEGLEARVEKLEQKIDELVKSRVGFSAALVQSPEWTSVGPFEQDHILKFEKVVTNIGNGYNPQTGVFTAPVKGLYYVRLTGAVGSTGNVNAALLKNDENMFAIYHKAGNQASASNGMVLALEQGDRLYAKLWASQTIADQSRLSTFSAFLVFPM